MPVKYPTKSMQNGALLDQILSKRDPDRYVALAERRDRCSCALLLIETIDHGLAGFLERHGLDLVLHVVDGRGTVLAALAAGEAGHDAVSDQRQRDENEQVEEPRLDGVMAVLGQLQQFAGGVVQSVVLVEDLAA